MPRMEYRRILPAGREGVNFARSEVGRGRSMGRTAGATRGSRWWLAIAAALAISSTGLAQEKRYELTTDDQWAPLAEADPDGEEAQLLEVR